MVRVGCVALARLDANPEPKTSARAAALPGSLDLRQRFGRSREAETRAGGVGEQRLHTRTDRLPDVRSRANGQSEIGVPLRGQCPIEHPVERVRDWPGLPHVQRNVLSATTDPVRSNPPQVSAGAETEP